MAGKKPVPQNSKDSTDPFNAGQMVGMLVMVTFIEKHKHVDAEQIEKLKWVCAANAGVFLEKPAEDVFLIIDNLVKEME